LFATNANGTHLAKILREYYLSGGSYAQDYMKYQTELNVGSVPLSAIAGYDMSTVWLPVPPNWIVSFKYRECYARKIFS
jgi:hypothetical protein